MKKAVKKHYTVTIIVAVIISELVINFLIF